MSEIYVVVNESFLKGSDIPVTEIASLGRWSYQDALDDLAEIAKENGIELNDDESSVYLPTEGSHWESDEYYIIPIEVADRG